MWSWFSDIEGLGEGYEMVYRGVLARHTRQSDLAVLRIEYGGLDSDLDRIGLAA